MTIFRLAWSIYFLFFLLAAVFANWLPRIPAIKHNLQLTDTVLGVCLAGAAIGAISVLLISNFLINLIGLKRSILIVCIVYFPFLILLGYAGNAATLFGILFVFGFCMSALEVLLNSKAAEFEKKHGSPIMATCHGFWSLGTIIGAFTGSLFAGWEFAPGAHFIIVTLILVLPGIYACFACPADSADSVKSDKVFTLPNSALLGLCIITFVALSIEGAVMDWSAIYMSETLGENPFVSGMAFTVFAATTTIGRFSGDMLRQIFPTRALMIASGLLTMVGLSAALFADSIAVVLAGFGVAGLGISMPYTLTIVAASERRDRPMTENVASLTIIGFLALLIYPPLIGLSSGFFGLRNSLAVLIPLALIFIVFAAELRKQ